MQADFSNISLAGPDDYARAAAMRDPNRRDRLANALAYYIPPELGGWMEMFDYINPVSDVGRAMQSSQNMLAPDRTAWERLGAFGSMATDIASVVAPAAAVRLAGGAAADGLVNALSFATMPADDALTRFAAADDGAIRAFHGSPHDFDRFSMDKIGTGEGAQAYGHGLYFAESEGVARSYRDVLSGDVSSIGDMAINTTRNPEDAISAWRQASAHLPKDVQDAVSYKLGQRLGAREILDDLDVDFYGEFNDEVAKILRSHPGRLYEVNINANPEDFLDWDRPLSEQPQKVREALGRFPVYAEAQARVPDGGIDLDALDGRAVLSQLEMGAGGREKLTPALREAGIPGIRYLDAGSRGAGDGSRNYVVFDENLIEIVKKYGIAGAAAIYGVNEADIQSAMPGGI